MKAMISTKFENGNIELPKNLVIRNGSKLFINIVENENEFHDILKKFYVEEIDDNFDEIDRIYNKNNLIF